VTELPRSSTEGTSSKGSPAVYHTIWLEECSSSSSSTTSSPHPRPASEAAGARDQDLPGAQPASEARSEGVQVQAASSSFSARAPCLEATPEGGYRSQTDPAPPWPAHESSHGGLQGGVDAHACSSAEGYAQPQAVVAPTQPSDQPCNHAGGSSLRVGAATVSLDVMQNGNPACPELPSAGSALHAGGTCTPCLFWFKGWCKRRQDCTYCHLVHHGQTDKRIRPSKRTRERKRMEAAAEAAAEAAVEEAGEHS